MSEVQPAEANKPSRAYGPVMLALGIIPNGLLLVAGIFLAVTVLGGSLHQYRGYRYSDLVYPMIFIGNAALNLTAFRRSDYRYRRIVFHLALVANALLILAGLEEWKGWFERAGARHIPYESMTLGLLGIVSLCGLLWSRLMSEGMPKFSLRQLSGAFVYVSLFCASASAILRPDRLHHYREQRPMAEQLQRLGATVGWADWQIDELYLTASLVTDDDLKLLARLPEISFLDLSSSNVTDAGLARIDACSKLMVLELGNTAVTDAGLVHLKKMNRLGFLNLNETNITDRGLQQLTHLKRLVVLYLTGTHVTKDGIDWLHEQLPNCRIHGNPGGEDYEVGP